MDLSVNYMGLKLKNPIIVGSSGLTNSVEKIRDLERQGAGAVVLKSLFEEQILMEQEKANDQNDFDYPEAMDYMKAYAEEYTYADFIQLIRGAKAAVDIPVIASVNCVSMGKWTEFAKKIEDAGADALEINISLLPSDIYKTSAQNEKTYFDIIEAVRKQVNIPIALKMSHYSAGLAHLIRQLSFTKMVDAFVLFNRYYAPDINIDDYSITSAGVLSRPENISDSLRWVALLSGKIKTPIAASTGVHEGEDVIKQILAGAEAVQVVSTLYKHGIVQLSKMLKDIETWMTEKGYTNLDDFRGEISYEKFDEPQAFERIQFMKYFGGFE
ncbi:MULTISPECIES: dihydroorotate dehydrogenase-like protein [unclassified Lentimicrobium]|uniref:dihydroorotate dehydrogenase-like protein n=1 Tax=unclassified Lentimicrobium TaxID=2677434 RepID=UPI0015577FE1|nr:MULTISPECIES: dihydroorotate dehydrogenase-like protein [unclassified Lentimicrobium]NPD45842.1 dihydroorotate dehydrogenase-like protein [Lentimicrobium sp. S6]NPD85793.1 dihydroorotate dehydrogenase-like protein [Lentimicrobium sp. L6]